MIYDYLKRKIIETLKNLNYSDDDDKLNILFALYNYGYIPEIIKQRIIDDLERNKRIICESFVYLLFLYYSF